MYRTRTNKQNITNSRRPIICPSGKIIAHDSRYMTKQTRKKMKNEKKRLLLISASLFIINLLVLVSLPNSNSSIIYGIIFIPLLFLVTGPFLIASIIAALLKYNDKEQKYPWKNLLMWVFIIFCIIIFISFIPTIISYA